MAAPAVAAVIALVSVTIALILAVKSMPATPEAYLSRYLPIHLFLDMASVVVGALVFLIGRSSINGAQARNTAVLGSCFLGWHCSIFSISSATPACRISLRHPTHPKRCCSGYRRVFWRLALWLLRPLRHGSAAVSRRLVDVGSVVAVCVVACISAVCVFAAPSLSPLTPDGQRMNGLGTTVQGLIVVLGGIAAFGFRGSMWDCVDMRNVGPGIARLP